MADVRVTHNIVEVEFGGDVRVTHNIVEVEFGGAVRVTHNIVEVEFTSVLPQITQLIAEVDVAEVGNDMVRVTQFLAEVDLMTQALRATQLIAEVDVSEESYLKTPGDFTLEAAIVEATTTSHFFLLQSKLAAAITQSATFTLAAELSYPPDRFFYLAATIRKSVPIDTEYYPDFSGPHEIRLLDHDGSLLYIIDQYTNCEFVRAVNGKYHPGYGIFSLRGAATLLPVDDFLLDRIIQVRRLPGGGLDPVVVFEGLIRAVHTYQNDEGFIEVEIRGYDFKHLMKRRIVLPYPASRAFWSYNGPVTDAMRYMVILNATFGAIGDRKMSRLRVRPLTHDGTPLDLHYRYTVVADELELLGNVDEGADWDLYQNGAFIDFEVYTPFKGRDRRQLLGSAPEMVWSIDRANVARPSFTEERLDEWTVVYAGGEGIGADRVIVERSNIAGREFDSPWNRIERFMDSGRDSAESTITASADAALVEHALVREFTVQAAPTQVLTYGSKWNLGDLCTGVFEAGGVFSLRIVEVMETLNRDNNGYTVTPTFFVYPRDEDY